MNRVARPCHHRPPAGCHESAGYRAVCVHPGRGELPAAGPAEPACGLHATRARAVFFEHPGPSHPQGASDRTAPRHRFGPDGRGLLRLYRRADRSPVPSVVGRRSVAWRSGRPRVGVGHHCWPPRAASGHRGGAAHPWPGPAAPVRRLSHLRVLRFRLPRLALPAPRLPDPPHRRPDVSPQPGCLRRRVERDVHVRLSCS